MRIQPNCVESSSCLQARSLRSKRADHCVRSVSAALALVLSLAGCDKPTAPAEPASQSSKDISSQEQELLPELGGLRVHLDAKQPVTVLDGAAISTWTALTGPSATQAEDNGATLGAPTYVASSKTMNGRPALRFGQSAPSALQFSVPGASAAPATSSELTVIVVGSRVTEAQPAYLWHNDHVATGVSAALLLGDIASGASVLATQPDGSASPVGGASPIGAEVATIATLRLTVAGRLDTFRDGTSTGTAQRTAGQTPLAGMLGYYLDADGSAPRLTTKGLISEVLVYDRALDDEELKDVHDHLNAKYSVVPYLGAEGLVQWLRADHCAGDFRCKGGACGVLAANCENLAPAGADALQSDKQRRPLAAQDPLTGRQVLRFDGVDDFMTLASGSSSQTDYTVVAVTAPTSPPAEVATWIRADKCTADGRTCTDLSGHGRNALCTGTDQTKCPQTVAGRLGGQPALVFPQTGYRLRISDADAPNVTEYTASFVFERWANGANTFVWLRGYTRPDGTLPMVWTYAAHTGAFFSQLNNYNANPPGGGNTFWYSAQPLTPIVMTVRVAAQRMELWVNGALVVSTPVASIPMAMVGDFQAAAYAEAIFYERALDDRELDRLHGYLSERYSLPLSRALPAVLSSASTWLRADQCSQDGMRCPDLSGNGRDAVVVSPDPTLRPQKMTTRVNGLPAMVFTKPGSKIRTEDSAAAKVNGYTVSFVAERWPDNTTTFFWLRRYLRPDGSLPAVELYPASTGVFFSQINNYNIPGGDGGGATFWYASQPQAPVVATVRIFPDRMELWVNGVLVATNSVTSIPMDMLGDMHAAALAEAVFFERPLTDPELGELHTYLRRRYALGTGTLPAAPTHAPGGGDFWSAPSGAGSVYLGTRGAGATRQVEHGFKSSSPSDAPWAITASATTARPQILTLRASGTQSELMVDCQSSATGANAAASLAGTLSSLTQPYQGALAEVLVFDHALSASQLNQVHAYLGNRYDVSSSMCSRGVCGNGTLEEAEACEPSLTEGCKTDCSGLYIDDCGNGVLDPYEGCDTALDPECGRTCLRREGFTPCSTNSQCPQGQACPPGNARQYGLVGLLSVCAPAYPCDTPDVSNYCGTPGAMCGDLCPCTPVCAGKTCGGDLSDGCGGICPGVCGRGDVCPTDDQCADGYVCVPGRARAFDPSAPQDAAACTFRECLAPEEDAIDCGDADSACGNCLACTPQCQGAICGAPDGCGGTCQSGSCAASGTVCVSGLCATALPLIHSTLGAPLPDSPALPGSTLSDLAIGVSPSGSATYSMPVPVAPGRAGMAPSLSVVYDSAAGDGYLGRGWSLQGLSRIHHCGRNLAQDGYSTGVLSRDSDALCLDGQRLVVVSPDAPNIMRTEPDTHVRVELDQAVRRAVVRSPDGTQRVYGRPGEAPVGATLALDRVLVLEQVRDQMGNAWSIRYRDTSADDPTEQGIVGPIRAAYWPEEIVYTQYFDPSASDQSTPSEQGVNTVKFFYEPEPCRLIGDAGLAVYQCRRLTEIVSSAGSMGVARLTFSYELNQMKSITRFGADGSTVGDTLEPLYTGGDAGGLFWHVIDRPYRGRLPNDARQFTGDFDGDGMTDVLVRSRQDYGPYHLVTRPDTAYSKFLVRYADVIPRDAIRHNGQGIIDITIGDFTLDGADDLILWLHGSSSSVETVDAQIYRFSTASQKFVPANIPTEGVITSIRERVLAGDVTGDGAIDLVVCGKNGESVWRTNGTQFFLHARGGNDLKCTGSRLADVDGDGAQEVLRDDGNSLTRHGTSTQYSNAREPAPADGSRLYLPLSRREGKDAVPFWSVENLSFGNFNNDGLPDAISYRQGGGYRIYNNLGAGHFSSATDFVASPIQRPTPIDINGDGYDELLWVDSERWQITYLYPERKEEALFRHHCSEDDVLEIEAPILGDFDGNGSTDAILTSDCDSPVPYDGVEYTILRGHVLKPGLLMAVRSATADGSAGDAVLYSDAIPDAFTYSPAHSRANWLIERPMRRPPWPVVARHQSDSGLYTRYFYKGSYTNPARREWVGFGERRLDSRVHDNSDPPPFSTNYIYDFRLDYGRAFHPFARLPKTVETRKEWTPGPASGNAAGTRDGELTRTTNTWELRPSFQGGSFTALVSQEVSTEPYHLDQATPPSFSVKSTTFTMDSFGNPLSETTLVNNSGTIFFSESTSRTFYPLDEAKWIASKVHTVASEACSDFDTTDTCGWTSAPVTYTYDENWLPKSSTTLMPGIESKSEFADDVTTTFVPDKYGNVEDMQHVVPGREAVNLHFKYDDTHTYVWTANDSSQRQYHTDYDPRFGTLVSERFTAPSPVPDAPALSGLTTQYSYDAFGRIGMIDHGDDTSSLFSYTGMLRTDPYGDRHFAFWVTPVLRTEVIHHRTVAGGDDLGRTIQHLDKLGRVVRTVVSGRKNMDVLVERKYNAFGSVATETRPHLAGDRSQEFTTFRYDEVGRLVSTQRPAEGTVTYERTYLHLLDAAYREQLLDLYGGRTLNSARLEYIEFERGGANHGAIAMADSMGRPLVTVDGAGSYSTFEYDRHGAISRLLDANGQAREWTRDFAGRVVGMVSPETDLTSAPVGTGYPAGRYTSFVNYFGDGKPRYVTTPSGATTFSYDSLGRVKTRSSEEGTTTYDWDVDSERGIASLGELLSVRGPTPGDTHSVHYEYDANHQLAAVVRTEPGQAVSNGLRLSIESEAGKTKSITYPSSNGAEAPFTVEYAYDHHGNVTAAESFGTGASKTYWREGDVFQGYAVRSEQRLRGALTRVFDHATGSLTSLSYAAAGVSRTVSYGYDTSGRVKTRKFSDELGTEEFAYDAANRLWTVSVRTGDALEERERYTYDAAGNLQGSPSGLHISNFQDLGKGNGTSRLISSGQTTGYAYDGAGRQYLRVGAAIPGGYQRLVYTSFDLPKEIYTGSGDEQEITTFEYDSLNVRASVRSPTSEVRYFGDLFEDRKELSPEGVPTRSRIFRVMVPEAGVVAEVVDRTFDGVAEPRRHITVVADLVESTIARDDDASGVLTPTSFSAFGQLRSGSAATGARFGGHSIDASLGLVNMRGRMYDAKLGQFLSEDPIIVNPFDPQGVSSYAYVRNNPVATTDSSGFAPDCMPGAPGCGGGGGDTGPGICLFGCGDKEGPKDPPKDNPLCGNGVVPVSNECLAVCGCTTGGGGGASKATPLSRTDSQDEGSQGTVSPSARDFSVEFVETFAGGGPLAKLPKVGQRFFAVIRSTSIWVKNVEAVTKWLTNLAGKLSARIGPGAADVAEVAARGAVCFAEGTLVHTEDGLRPIEEIKEGDLVWSRDEATGEVALRRVVRTFVTPDQPVLKLVLRGAQQSQQDADVLLATAEHPFWTARGWVGAQDLVPGDSVLVLGDEWAYVEEVMTTAGRTVVYNFEVEEFHTYFVGAQGAWVHNECAAQVATRALTRADLGLGKAALAELQGTVTTAGSTRIVRVDMIRGDIPIGELRSAMGSAVDSARAAGMKVLQFEATFANPRLQQFVSSQAARFGGTVSSSGATDTITFMLGGL